MGKSPYAAPYTVEITASWSGIPYATSATSSADTSADIADIQAGLRQTPSIRNRTTIGMAATTVDIPRLPAIGS